MHATSGLRRPPRYEGEDIRPLRQMELWGWYAYGIGAEVFAVCGVGMCSHTFSRLRCSVILVADATDQARSSLSLWSN